MSCTVAMHTARAAVLPRKPRDLESLRPCSSVPRYTRNATAQGLRFLNRVVSWARRLTIIYIFCCVSVCAVIDIGFERTVVSVGEDDGTVQLCVIITNDVEIDRDAQVDILTQPGTAEGTYVD